MRSNIQRTRRQTYIAAAILAAFLAILACALPGSEPESTPTQPPAPTDTPIPTATPTDIPTPTTTPTPDPGCTSFRPASIIQITLDHDGDLWSAGSGGITRWDIDTGSYYTFSMDDGVPDSGGEGVLTDGQGQIWVNWDSANGVSRYSQGEWTHFGIAQGLADNCMSGMALADDGSLWFSTEKGISSFDGETWTSYGVDDGLPSIDVKVLATSPGGNVWAVTDAGVASFDGAQWIDHNRLVGARVYDITTTQDGRIWFATDDRIYYFYGDTWGYVLGSDIRYTIPGGEHYSFAVATDGTLWSTAFFGIVAYDGDTWVTFRSYDTGLPPLMQRNLHAMKDGSVWIMGDELFRLSQWRIIDEENYQVLIEQICIGDGGQVLRETFSVDDLTSCPPSGWTDGQALQTADGTMIFVTGLGDPKGLLILRTTGEYSIFSFDESE